MVRWIEVFRGVLLGSLNLPDRPVMANPVFRRQEIMICGLGGGGDVTFVYSPRVELEQGFVHQYPAHRSGPLTSGMTLSSSR